MAAAGVPGGVGAQAPAREELLAIARAVVAGAPFVSLATVDEGRYPAVRAMDGIAPDENWVVWLATNPASRKVAHLREQPRVALHYLDAGGASYVTLIGRARLVDDPAMKARHWKESWTPFYPDRDEGVLLIEVTPIRLEVVSEGRGAPGDPETWRAHVVEFGPGTGLRPGARRGTVARSPAQTGSPTMVFGARASAGQGSKESSMAYSRDSSIAAAGAGSAAVAYSRDSSKASMAAASISQGMAESR